MNKVQNKSFDLEERTALFGENVIGLCQNLSISTLSKPVIEQVIRSSTSIGANYSEANGASSLKDFRNKIAITKKESKETKHWLRMLIKCYPNEKEQIAVLFNEAHELTLIFSAIFLKIK